jgi:hypothetical protein
VWESGGAAAAEAGGTTGFRLGRFVIGVEEDSPIAAAADARGSPLTTTGLRPGRGMGALGAADSFDGALMTTGLRLGRLYDVEENGSAEVVVEAGGSIFVTTGLRPGRDSSGPFTAPGVDVEVSEGGGAPTFFNPALENPGDVKDVAAAVVSVRGAAPEAGAEVDGVTFLSPACEKPGEEKDELNSLALAMVSSMSAVGINSTCSKTTCLVAVSNVAFRWALAAAFRCNSAASMSARSLSCFRFRASASRRALASAMRCFLLASAAFLASSSPSMSAPPFSSFWSSDEAVTNDDSGGGAAAAAALVGIRMVEVEALLSFVNTPSCRSIPSWAGSSVTRLLAFVCASTYLNFGLLCRSLTLCLTTRD